MFAAAAAVVGFATWEAVLDLEDPPGSCAVVASTYHANALHVSFEITFALIIASALHPFCSTGLEFVGLTGYAGEVPFAVEESK